MTKTTSPFALFSRLVRDAMAPAPPKIEATTSCAVAVDRMIEAASSCVLVEGSDGVLGIVTERDIGLVENAVRDSRESGSLKVRDACELDAYVVDLSAPLDRVLADMAERHIGSVLVVKRGQPAGIFTSSDACHHFGRFLTQFFDSGGDDAA